MKIAIEGQRLFRKKKHGMDFVALELIRNLMHIDKENQYYIFVAPGEDRCLESMDNFQIVELKAPGYPFWEQIALPRAVKRFKCDLLHCTSNTAPLYSPVPLIVTLHDIIYLEKGNKNNSQASNYQKLGNLYRKLVVPYIFKKSYRVITVSEFERKQIGNYFGLDKSAHLTSVHNGVSLHFKKITDKETLSRVKEKYKLPDNFFFHLGNSDPKKNTFGVISAFSQYIKDTKADTFLVMPDFDKNKLQAILTQIGHPDLMRKIILTGYIINTDLSALYSLCSVFLYPSLRESFGIPILEAMKCGVPVITSNTSSMPEISGKAAILVNPKDVQAIVQAIKLITTQQEVRNKLIEEGFKQAAKFSWGAMADSVLQIYQKQTA